MLAFAYTLFLHRLVDVIDIGSGGVWLRRGRVGRGGRHAGHEFLPHFPVAEAFALVLMVETPKLNQASA